MQGGLENIEIAKTFYYSQANNLRALYGLYLVLNHFFMANKSLKIDAIGKSLRRLLFFKFNKRNPALESAIKREICMGRP